MPNNVDMGSINWTVKASAEEASNQVKQLSTNISGLSKVLKLVNFAGFIAGCKKIGQTIYNLVQPTSEYIQTMNRFKGIMGESSNAAQDFVSKAEKILGLDPEQMMGSLSSFQTLAKGFGIASDEAYKMSKNLTQLAADMSSFTGESMDLALQRIKSGISGEIEPMRKWGIALDQATLQETAYALGINKRVAEMTRAQKTELAYYQIMHATQYAQGNMARTLLTPANALRVVQTEFKQLARAMGSIFIPIVMKIIPYVRALTQIFTELARKIAAFFGFKMSDYEFSASPVQDIASAFGDVEDNVGKATKALKKMLMPFDELNNVNFDTGSISSGGTGDVGGGSLGLDTYDYDMFAGASDEINKKVEQIKETFERLKPVLIAIGGVIAGIWAIDKIVTFIEWLKRVKSVGSELQSVFELALVVGGAFLIYKGIKRAIETDWDAQSLLMMIGGTGLIAAAGALKFKSIVPLQLGLEISLMIGSAWLLYKGIKKTMEEGFTPEGLLMILGGAVGIISGGFFVFKTLAKIKLGTSISTSGLDTASTSISSLGTTAEQAAAGTISLKSGFNSLLSAFGKAAEIIALLGGLALVINSVTNLINVFSQSGLTLGEVAGLLGITLGGVTVAFVALLGAMTLLEPSWQSIAGAAVIFAGFSLVIHEVSKLLEVFAKTGISVNDVIKLMAAVFVPVVALMAVIAALGPAMTVGLIPFLAVVVGISAILIVMSQTIPIILAAAGNFVQKVAPSISNILNIIFQGIERIINALGKSLPPIINSIGGLFLTIFNGVDRVINSVGNVIIRILETTNSLVNNVFNGILSFINRLGPAINNFVSNLISAVTRLINFLISGLEFLVNTLVVPTINGIISAVNVIPGVSLSKASRVYIPRFYGYEDGGFPEKGQFFFANESGPELIGNIGNRTAVANQQQITDGIAEATYNAFTRALNENQSNNDGSYFIINLEGDALYKGYAKKKNQYSNMYGLQM